MSDPLNEVKWWHRHEVDQGYLERIKASPTSERFREAVMRMVEYVGEDSTRPGLLDTPERVRRAWLEMFAGYWVNVPGLFQLFDAEACDEMVVVKDVEFVSVCEHHLLQFEGVAHVAYLPSSDVKKVIGLSKVARIVDAFARRMQIQEKLTAQIADAIFDHAGLAPKGVGVVVEAHHSCMSCRGVRKRKARMVTSALRGAFKSDPATRAEFLNLVRPT